MQRVGNLSLSISLEGFEEVNDLRRGEGVFDRVMKAMDLLKKYGLIFGTSICYTSKNISTVTSDEFLDMIIEKGCRFTWYFHYMPVGNDASVDLLPTMEQRKYMYHRVREIRGATGGKQIFAMDFQNDGEFVGGCIAGGRNYFHINANGDVEPCVFIHYSSANIHDVTLPVSYTHLGKAIRPEVAIIHVPRCDIYGNIQVDPTDKIKEMENLRLALCASHIIVTAEQIVTSKAIQMNQRNMVMESDKIDFVMETPYGSFPTCEEGRYRADEMDDVQLLKAIEEYKDWEKWINDIDVMKLLYLTTNRRGE